MSVVVAIRLPVVPKPFAKLSPLDKLARFLEVHPKEAAALVGLMDEVWAKKARERRRLRP